MCLSNILLVSLISKILDNDNIFQGKLFYFSQPRSMHPFTKLIHKMFKSNYLRN